MFSLEVNVRVRPSVSQMESLRRTGELGSVEKVLRSDGRVVGIDIQTLGPYNRVFSEEKSQDQLYQNMMSSYIDQFMKGINCTIFLYGQTGSGKTHTLFGPPKFFH